MKMEESFGLMLKRSFFGSKNLILFKMNLKTEMLVSGKIKFIKKAILRKTHIVFMMIFFLCDQMRLEASELFQRKKA